MDPNTPSTGGVTRPPVPVAPAASRVVCAKCGRFVDATYAFCPHCGRRQAQDEAWYYQPAWILLLAFLAIGPLALFLVWKSTKMSQTAKILTAISILAYTVICAYLAYRLTAIEMRQLRQLGNVMHQLQSL